MNSNDSLSSSSQQSNLSHHSTEITHDSYSKLQDTVQLLLKNQESLIQVCNKQKNDLKKLKELVKTKDNQFNQFYDIVFPFCDKYTWDEVTINKVSLIQN